MTARTSGRSSPREATDVQKRIVEEPSALLLDFEEAEKPLSDARRVGRGSEPWRRYRAAPGRSGE